MLNSGLKLRTFKSHKRYSFSRTFGATRLLEDCEFDNGLSNFNQNEPNPVTGDPAYPNGCTAFARADMATNEDHILYSPGFTYLKSCMIANVPVGSALPMETAFTSGKVYGLQAVGETTDAQALTHRRGPYFEVDRSNDDWFDSLWSALQTGKKCLSVGTVWFPEMTEATIVDTVNIRPTIDAHDWEVTGVTTQNGIPRMHVKWWGGEPKWFGRAAVNALMNASGSDCLTDVDGKATPADIQTIRLSIMQVLLSYYQELLVLFKTPTGGTAGPFIVWEEMEEEVEEIQKEITNLPKPSMEQTFPPMIIKWSEAIGRGEGADPASNNPGNLKLSTLTKSWGATEGRAATDGGFLCHFSTAQQGQDALCNFLKLGCENELLAFHSPEARTIRGFTVIYAGNPPEGYIQNILNELGVPGDTNIATFL